jgi:hypothetical protein
VRWNWLLTMGLVAWLTARSLLSPAPLYGVFQASGAEAVGYAINDWVVLEPGTTTAPLSAYDARLARALGVTAPPRRTVGAGWVKWSAARSTGSVATTTLAEQLASGRVYLVVDRSVGGGLQGFQEALTATAALLRPFGPVHTNVTVIGSMPGRWLGARARAVIGRMLAAGGAREVNAITATNLVSLSAYGDRLGPALHYGRHRVNLEIAFAYDPLTRTTAVLVGSPVITVTY